MKIISETSFLVVGKANPTLSQDGKSTYYKIACLQNGQATNVSVSEEIYNEIPDGMVDAVFSTSTMTSISLSGLTAFCGS